MFSLKYWLSSEVVFHEIIHIPNAKVQYFKKTTQTKNPTRLKKLNWSWSFLFCYVLLFSLEQMTADSHVLIPTSNQDPWSYLLTHSLVEQGRESEE